MSTILKQPDAFSFSGNIKPLVISSTTEVFFELSQAKTSGRTIVLSEKFQPGADNLVTIPLNGIIDHLLDVTIPDNLDIVNEQPLAVGNFFTMVDGVASPFVAIKEGVAEMQEMASEWLSSHFLSNSFTDRVGHKILKNNKCCVRAIRAFEDVALPTVQPVLYFTPRQTIMTFASPVTVSAKDGVLSLNLRSSMAWRYNSTLKIESFLGGTKTGMTTLSPSASMRGYQSADDQ